MNEFGKDAVTPVMFGMAGVIYREARKLDELRVEDWIHRGFVMTPNTTRTEWRSDSMVIATYHHSGESRTTPGSFDRPMPKQDRRQGVLFGYFFELNESGQQVAELSLEALKGYGAVGPEYFQQLNGGFTCVIWDEEKRQAHFVRDSTGLQVLHVSSRADCILFASDLRVFQASGLLDAVDEQSVAEFLHYLYVPAPRTLATNCESVLPGHVLTAGASTRQVRYCGPRFVSGPRLSTPGEIDREIASQLPVFEDKLMAAVADCLPRSGRIALTLSGGKDSSALAIALSKLCPERVLAMTVGQQDGRFDESSDAQRVCRFLGLEHYSYTPTDADLARGIVKFAGVQDQVVGDPAALPYYLGMCSLPDDCTVILDGTGNDFYFGMPSPQKGVWHYQKRARLENWLPGPAWPLLLAVMARGTEGTKRLGRLWSRPVEESFLPWHGWSASELRELCGRDISFVDTYLWKVMKGADPEQWLAVNTEQFGRVWEPNANYRKAIDSAHSAGRGIRYPFVDNRLAAYVNALPEQLKHKDGINKQLLRAYMSANLSPEILAKPKLGFIFDLNRLLANPEFQWVNELAREGLYRLLPTWSQRPIDKLLDDYARAPSDLRWQQRLYALSILVTVFAVKNGHRWKHPVFRQ